MQNLSLTREAGRDRACRPFGSASAAPVRPSARIAAGFCWSTTRAVSNSCIFLPSARSTLNTGSRFSAPPCCLTTRAISNSLSSRISPLDSRHLDSRLSGVSATDHHAHPAEVYSRSRIVPAESMSVDFTGRLTTGKPPRGIRTRNRIRWWKSVRVARPEPRRRACFRDYHALRASGRATPKSTTCSVTAP